MTRRRPPLPVARQDVRPAARRWCVCGVAVVALLGAPAAQASWTAPRTISVAGTTGADPQVAVDRPGNATAVWTSGSSPSRSIRSAYRPAGGDWEASFTRMPGASDCHDARLAVNAAGASVVVADCSGDTVRAAYRPAGGSWASAVAVPGATGSGSRVGIDGAGTVTAVWRDGTAVWSSRRSAGSDGTWEAAQQVSPPGTVALSANVAVSTSGLTTAYWRRDLLVSGKASVETSRRTAIWEAPVPLTLPPTSTSPKVRYEPQMRWNLTNQRVAVWDNLPMAPVGGDPSFLESWWGNAGTWGDGGATPHRTASDGTTSVEAPQVAIDNAGRSTAVWRVDAGGGAFRPQASTTSSLNGAWSTPVLLADDLIGVSQPQVASAARGDATAVWRGDATGRYVIRAATRPPGGAFAPAASISDPDRIAQAPQVVSDVFGNAVVAWTSSGFSDTRVDVAINDIGPPQVTELTVPTTVQAGSTAAMTVAATDVWSGPPVVRWDLGDGAAATGTAIEHRYDAPGVRTVTVTATDGVGNVATQTQEVTVMAPPPPPPGGGGTPGGSVDGAVAGGGAAGEGGATLPPGGRVPSLAAVRLDVSLPKQSRRTVRKTRAIRARCRLDVAGTCGATATVTRGVAKRLRLAVPKRARTLRIGRGTARIARGGRTATLRIALTRGARSAIGRSARRVRVAIAVTGSAPGRRPATVTKGLTVRR